MQIRLYHAQLITSFKSCLDSENAFPVIFISSPGDRSFHKKKLISFSFLLLTNTKNIEENEVCLFTPCFGNFQSTVPSLQNRISKEQTTKCWRVEITQLQTVSGHLSQHLLNFILNITWGLVECLPGMYKVMKSILSTRKNDNNLNETKDKSMKNSLESQFF